MNPSCSLPVWHLLRNFGKMCNCKSMVRIPDSETMNGKYPMPVHSPACEDFTQEEFTRLEYDGTYCIMEPHEAKAMIADENCSEDGVVYDVSTVLLTRDQFDNLKEFEGF